MEQFKSVRYGFMFDDIVNKNIQIDKIKPDKDYEDISDEDDNNLNLFRKPLGTIESDLILLYDPIEERIFVAQVLFYSWLIVCQGEKNENGAA